MAQYLVAGTLRAVQHGGFTANRWRRIASVLAALVALGSGAAAAAPLFPSVPVGPPSYTVNVNDDAGAPGYIYYSSGVSAAAIVPGVGQALSDIPSLAPANIVLDKAGRQVWRYDPPHGQDVSNFRTQTYQGKPVMTWWQGTAVGGHGEGADYIADEHGTIIESLTPGTELTSDVHEFRLTDDGRALITSYRQVPADLSAIGGPRDGQIYDCIASVVDVATKNVLFQWDPADHVPLTDSYQTTTAPGDPVADPYHMNSIALDPAGNLLISLRNTSAVYDVDIHTGDIAWQLGGKQSSFTLGPGVQFAYQHDAEFADPNTIRLFNNNSSGQHTLGISSVQWIHLDPDAHTATLQRNQPHPDNLVSAAMGNAQALPNGNTFTCWGWAPHISEFTPTGTLVYDASLPLGTYRAYLENWAPVPP